MSSRVKHVRNDNGSTSSVDTWGPAFEEGDAVHMEELWLCGPPCKINKYDEDGDVVEYRGMNILQMRDHLIYFHKEKGDVLFEPWMEQLLARVNSIEGAFNRTRQAKEEAEAEEVAKLKKEYGYA